MLFSDLAEGDRSAAWTVTRDGSGAPFFCFLVCPRVRFRPRDSSPIWLTTCCVRGMSWFPVRDHVGPSGSFHASHAQKVSREQHELPTYLTTLPDGAYPAVVMESLHDSRHESSLIQEQGRPHLTWAS